MDYITKEECSNHKNKTMAKLDELKGDIYEIKVLLAGLPDTIFERADKRYSGKSVEKIVYGLVGLVLTSFFYYIIK